MGLKTKLTTAGSSLSNLNGTTPSIPNFAGSKLHNEYSLNGNPTLTGKPTPSLLDLAVVPTKYMDNLPL